MSPEQALQVFAELRLKFQASGQDHEVIAKAFQVLKDLVEPKKDDSPKEGK